MAKKRAPTYSDGKLVLTENQKDGLWTLDADQPATAAELYRNRSSYITSVKSASVTLHGLMRLGLVAKTTVAFYGMGDRQPLFRERHIWTLTRKGAAWLMVAEREE